MILHPHDLMDLNALAASHADQGKRQAWRAYTAHAVERRWEGTPAWVAGRTAFTALWRGHRAAYRASMASLTSRYSPAGHTAP